MIVGISIVAIIIGCCVIIVNVALIAEDWNKR